MNLADSRALLDHAHWADALMWRAVMRLDRLDPELSEKLHHLHAAQWVYLQVWRSEPVAPRGPGAFSDLSGLCDWARQFHWEASRHLDGMADDEATRDIAYPWRDELARRFGPARPTAWCDSVLQVALHSTYHRGQVARRVRELGGEPPTTDYIAWVWLGRPPAHWG